jgi:hypothetical protein
VTCVEFRVITGRRSATLSEWLYAIKHALCCPACHTRLRRGGIGQWRRDFARVAELAARDPELRGDAEAINGAIARRETGT